MKNKIVLKASAGTGKTYRLSLEFIKNLIENKDYKEILVMTFTRKATAEIKERILDFLYQIAFEKGNYIDLEKSLSNLYNINEIEKEKLKNLYFEMIKNKDEIRIFTIDGFTNKIFQNVIAPTLSIYNYEILDNETDDFFEELLQDVIKDENLFEKLKFFIYEIDEKKNPFIYAQFLKNLLELQGHYLIKQNSKSNSLNNLKPKFVEEDFIKYLDNIFNYFEIAWKKKFSKNEIDSSITSYLIKDFSNIYSEFKNASNNFDEKLKIVMKNWSIFFDKLSEENIFYIWNKNKLQSTKTCNLNEEHENMLNNSNYFIKNLSNYIYNKKIITINEHFEDFCYDLYKFVENKKILSKKFTHNDISNYTYKFIFGKNFNFVNNSKPTNEFFNLIGGNVSTVMIDEFQDTSILQWKILKLIINNAQDVICVGDEKQSIYSWRGGEKQLFQNLENILEGKVETLNKSYRSYKMIIETVNKIYENYRDDWQYYPVFYREDEEYQSGYFSYDININKKEEGKCYEKIINILKSNIITNYGKSCIICRNNTDINDIVKRLNYENIPYTLVSNAPLIEHEGIKPIYKLIKFFIYNNFQYLLEFIRSDLIGGINDHVQFILENKDSLSNFDFNDENLELMKRNNRLFSKVLKDIEELKTLSLNLNNKQLIENFSKEIVKRFDVINYYSSNSDLKNIFNFFNILKSHNNLYEFITYMEENKYKITQQSSDDVDSINIMTIHKSKGLEFDTVFYYKKDSTKKTNSIGILPYIKYDNHFENIDTFFIIFQKYNKIFIDGENLELKNLLNLKEEIEEINADYVALTRAKKNLFIHYDTSLEKNNIDFKTYFANKLVSSFSPSNNDPNIISFKNGIICETNKLKNKDISEKSFSNIMNFFNDNHEKQTVHSKYKISLKGEFKRKEGLAIHYYLEHLTNDLETEIPIANSVFLNRYANMLGEKRVQNLLNKIENFVQSHKYIYDKKYVVYNELEIFDEYGNKKIMDRVNIDNDKMEIHIFDYKTGEEAEKKSYYKKQINEYKELLDKKLKGKYKIVAQILEV